MSGVWQRDERVLRWVLTEFEQSLGSYGFQYETNPPEPVPELDGMLSSDLHASLFRLFQYGLIGGRAPAEMRGQVSWERLRPTVSGRIVLGEWPDLDRFVTAEGMRAVLDALAPWAPEEAAPRLREAAAVVGQAGDDVVRETIGSGAASASNEPETWERRDLPVLQLLARPGTIDIDGGFTLSDARLRELGADLTFDEALPAIQALADLDYVDGQGSLEDERTIVYTLLFVTGRGMRALGEWPSFTDLTPKTLGALLDRLADETADQAQAAETRAAGRDIRVLGGGPVEAAVSAASAQQASDA
jgi:hypothetical protein